mgnify:CR=1 FL=1
MTRRRGSTVMVTQEPLSGPGWFSFEADPFMVLSIRSHWAQLSDYEQDLRKKYRARLKKNQQLTRAVAVQPVSLEDPDLRARCAKLLEQTLVDKVVALPGDTEALLLKFALCFGSKFKAWGFFSGGVLEAFITLVEDGPVLRAMHFGKSTDSDPSLYSKAMFHAIELGIEGSFAEVHLGRTATEIKSTYGAQARPNYFSFYTQNWWWRRLLKRAQKRYLPGVYTLRDALKDSL